MLYESPVKKMFEEVIIDSLERGFRTDNFALSRDFPGFVEEVIASERGQEAIRKREEKLKANCATVSSNKNKEDAKTKKPEEIKYIESRNVEADKEVDESKTENSKEIKNDKPNEVTAAETFAKSKIKPREAEAAENIAELEIKKYKNNNAAKPNEVTAAETISEINAKNSEKNKGVSFKETGKNAIAAYSGKFIKPEFVDCKKERNINEEWFNKVTGGRHINKNNYKEKYDYKKDYLMLILNQALESGQTQNVLNILQCIVNERNNLAKIKQTDNIKSQIKCYDKVLDTLLNQGNQGVVFR